MMASAPTPAVVASNNTAANPMISFNVSIPIAAIKKTAYAVLIELAQQVARG